MVSQSENTQKTWLVTGSAGFIGFHLAKRLMEQGERVIGFDNVNDYYDPSLKEGRLKVLDQTQKKTGAFYQFYREDLADHNAVDQCFSEHKIDKVIHLAAQAGVRYSLENPRSYAESNLMGFTNILEACRYAECNHLVYASSSSVYGANTNLPSSVHGTADHPLQFYAATKRANEIMAHSYSHLYKIPTTGLRFFTVYGPWGRPDMALFKFTRAILAGEPIDLYNHGNHSRDFTFVDDIVESLVRIADKIPQPDPEWDPSNPGLATSNAPYRVLNIGNSSPVMLNEYVSALENVLGTKAAVNSLPLQPGDLPDTFADTKELVELIDFRPQTSVEEGISQFVAWYRDFYKTA